MNDYEMAGMGISLAVELIVGIVFAVLFIFLHWKAFTKAGHEGWKSIIPIINTITISQIAVGNSWYWLLGLIPFVGIIFIYILTYKYYKSFGISTGIAILSILILPIAPFMIAFDNNVKYEGPV